MIFDSLKNIALYKGMHPNIDCAIHFLMSRPLDVEEGKTVIDGEKVFANVMRYVPKSLEEGNYEAHRHYADIQIVLEGKEKFYHSSIEEVACITPYNEETDIAFYKGDAKSECILEEGKFVICMPTDAHMPGIACGISPLKKMVIKVKLD